VQLPIALAELPLSAGLRSSLQCARGLSLRRDGQLHLDGRPTPEIQDRSGALLTHWSALLDRPAHHSHQLERHLPPGRAATTPELLVLRRGLAAPPTPVSPQWWDLARHAPVVALAIHPGDGSPAHAALQVAYRAADTGVSFLQHSPELLGQAGAALAGPCKTVTSTRHLQDARPGDTLTVYDHAPHTNRLVQAARKRGIRIVLALYAGHQQAAADVVTSLGLNAQTAWVVTLHTDEQPHLHW
jgi:hypothetical protein